VKTKTKVEKTYLRRKSKHKRKTKLSFSFSSLSKKGRVVSLKQDVPKKYVGFVEPKSFVLVKCTLPKNEYIKVLDFVYRREGGGLKG
jgi:hypothetical protein